MVVASIGSFRLGGGETTVEGNHVVAKADQGNRGGNAKRDAGNGEGQHVTCHGPDHPA